MNTFHTPVLLKEVIENLRVESGKKYIDATIGGGGHSFEILKRGGVVLGIDVDKEAINYIKSNFQFSIFNFQLKLVRGNFRDIDKVAKNNEFDHVKRGYGNVSGIIFDLGVSSHQLESASRGFSFQKEGPLDIRMDQELQVRAKDLINILTKGELYELFSKLGEESRAGEFSRRIVSARRIKRIETTRDLAEIIEKGLHRRFSGIHPATKIFQALRIAVNDELNALKEALPKALTLLEKDGRILVISFHSLEDRIVKHAFLEFAKEGEGIIITKKPITPTTQEIEKNARSRSAKLRVFEIRSRLRSKLHRSLRLG